MAEYIEKAELIKKLCFETAEWYYSPTIKTIKEFPAADVQPVKLGKWECEHYDELIECYVANCSECGYESTDNYRITPNHRYCEYCGTRMIKDGVYE